MKVLICWSNISGYMAACWRALAAADGIDLRVFAFAPKSGGASPFDRSIMNGVDARLVDPAAADFASQLGDLYGAFRPDVAVVSGWIHDTYVGLAAERRSEGKPTLMTLDQPWLGTARQRLQALRRRRHASGMTRVVTASVWADEYARRLGVAPERLRGGLYGFDAGLLRGPLPSRTHGVRRSFVFVGRLVEQKGVEALLAAYDSYRGRVSDPWGLVVCGTGPLLDRLSGRPGVEARGFVQPVDLPGVLRGCDAFVLPSRYEPWGVVVAEAAAAGLPLILSDRVGAGIDLLRSHHNGFGCVAGDSVGLASALERVHRLGGELPAFGRRSRELASAYSSDVWARRWAAVVEEAMGAAGPPLR